jgi:sugar phosphate permease
MRLGLVMSASAMTTATVASATVAAPATVMAPAMIAATMVCTVVVAVMMTTVEAIKAKPTNQAGPKEGISGGIVASVTKATWIIGILLIVLNDGQHHVAARSHALCVANFIRNSSRRRGGDCSGG